MAKEERRIDRKLEEVKELVKSNIDPTCAKAIELTMRAVNNKKVSARVGMVRVLAVDQWFVDNIVNEAHARRLPEDILREFESETHLVEAEKRAEIIEKLIGKNPSALSKKQLLEELNKWKWRVKAMSEGQYS